MKVGNTTIRVVRGSLLDQKVDVIVNAANKELRAGGGICGAIFEQAGKPELEAYIANHYPKTIDTALPFITPAFDLPYKAIIHIAGPIYDSNQSGSCAFQLNHTYTNALAMARDFKFRSVGFCSISTGIYGYPIDDAAEIAMKAIVQFIEYGGHNFGTITLAMFQQTEYDVYAKALRKIKRLRKQMRAQ